MDRSPLHAWCGNDGAPTAVSLSAYPDGMPLVSFDLGVRCPSPKHAQLSYNFLLRPTNMGEFMAAMFLVDAYRERGAKNLQLMIPFLPGARQDRLASGPGDQLFTAKSIAREINVRGFDRVTCLDPHSEVMPALIDRCRVVHAYEVINPPAGKYGAVISPDAGAEKRAGAVAKKLGVPLIHAWKTRDIKDGKISGFGIDHQALDEVCGGSVPGATINPRKVLIVDDICDGGGTFRGLSHILPAWVDPHLWATHGLFTQGTEDLRNCYSHIYTTDSIPRAPAPGVIVVPVCEELMKGWL